MPAPAPACPRALGWAALAIVLLGAPRPARAGDPAPAPIPPAWVEIATVEHVRGNPARLDPFLNPDSDAEARRRAIVALGRIGDRKGVAERLRDLLRGGGADLSLALEAAGVSEAKSLVVDVLPYLERDPKTDAAALAAALGAVAALGDTRADGYVLPFLASAMPPALRIAALNALARLGSERTLEAVSPALDDPDAGVRRAAAGAAWRVGGARRKARSKPDAPWAGDADLATRVAATVATDADAEIRLFAMRALNVLTSKTLVATGNGASRPDAVLLGALADADPRIAADLAFRLGATHDGADLDAAFAKAATNEDPLARQTVVESCHAKPTDAAKALLKDRASKENDARVREALAVALAGVGLLEDAKTLLARSDRPADPGAKALTEARVWLAAKEWAQAIAFASVPGTPAIARAEVLDGLASAEGVGEPGIALARRALADPDVVVRANAAALLGKAGGCAALPGLVAAYEPESGRADQDFRGAIVGAVAEIAGGKAEDPAGSLTAAALVARATQDPSPAVRLAARAAAGELGKLGPPSLLALAEAEDPRPNEWVGLPRPKVPLLGLDLTQGGPWLSEEEILRLAEAIRVQHAQVVLETDAGAIHLELDPANAPVHAANLVLLASGGVYDGTPWHRVVPAFVIQGGDPHGDGSGDAGYAVPDEITSHPFVRGALGMPKSTKDTGGCQVFLMHCAGPHLDGRYTCYGQATEGIEVIDCIRVGDRIRTARVGTAPR